MKVVYWQKLILRGFGTYEDEISVDFTPGVNLLPAEEAAGRTSLIPGLAATLFGLDQPGEGSHTAERYYNRNKPQRFDGELFFQAQEEHYHLQRLFADNRVRLRRWNGSDWLILYDDLALPRADHQYNTLLQQLFGVTDMESFLKTVLLGDPNDDPEDGDRLRNLLTARACPTQALENLRAEIYRLTRYPAAEFSLEPGVHDGEREENQQRQKRCREEISQALQQEEKLLSLRGSLADLQREQQKDTRRFKRLADLQGALRVWQTHAERYQELSTRLAELEQAAKKAIILEQQLLQQRAAVEALCRDLETTPEVMTRRFTELSERYRMLRQAEDNYLKAQTQLMRYGPLPLPPDALLPLVERRLELLLEQKQSGKSINGRYLSAPLSATLSALLGIGAALALYLAWGQKQQIIGLALCFLCGLGSAALAYRLLPREPGMDRISDDPLSQELQEQRMRLGGIALMDPVALQGFIALLTSLQTEFRERPDREELQSAEDNLAELNEQTTEYQELCYDYETLRQDYLGLLQQHGAASADDLRARQTNTAQEASRELSAWRRFCLQYPELPEVRGRELAEALEQFEQLQQEFQGLQQRCGDAEEKTLQLQQNIQELQGHQTMNIALLQERVGQLEQRFGEIEDELQILSLTWRWMTEAESARIADCRKKLQQRLAAYLRQCPETQNYSVNIGEDFRLYLEDQQGKTPLGELPQDLRDLLRLMLKPAVADYYSGGYSLPLIIDASFPEDVLADSTENDSLRRLLFALGEERQVWFLNHQKHASWGESQVIHKII